MNSISVNCTCGKSLVVPPNLAGKSVRCPHCSATLKLQPVSPERSKKITCGCGQVLSFPASLQGKKVKCPKCSSIVSTSTTQPNQPSAPNPAVEDPFSNLADFGGAATPYAPPAGQFATSQNASQPAPKRSKSQYRSYAEVPWIRRSGTNTVFMLVHMLTCGLIPLLFVTCVILLSGQVYYDQKEENGSLKVWSPVNKVVAFLLLIPAVFVIVTFGVAFVGGALRAIGK